MSDKSIEVLNINFKNGKIQNCIVKVDEKTFNVVWKSDRYIISGNDGDIESEDSTSKKSSKGKDKGSADQSSANVKTSNIPEYQSGNKNQQNTTGSENVSQQGTSGTSATSTAAEEKSPNDEIISKIHARIRAIMASN